MLAHLTLSEVTPIVVLAAIAFAVGVACVRWVRSLR